MAMQTVQTCNGTFQGVPVDHGICSVFRGIPYAMPPVGDLRFRPPVPPEPWEGIRRCDRFAPAPVQPRVEYDDYEISEDCLYLNLWTPAEEPEEKLPVMVWIYGGAFTWGFSHEALYDGTAIAEKKCIFVTINYRVNIFGFFNTPEMERMNGGARCIGILDQIAAIDWLRENVSSFGGDPDNILVFGYSAGGISARMLLTSPLAWGKIAKAVVHSGGGLNEADLIRNTGDFTDMCMKALKHVGWTFEDVMRRDAVEVMEVMMKGVREMMADGDIQYFQPFIDGYALTEIPGKAIQEGRYQKIPIMCGTVAGDSWMFTRKVLPQIRDRSDYLRAFTLSPHIAWARNNIKRGYPGIYSYYMDRTQPVLERKYYTHGGPPFGRETPHGSEIAYIFGTLDLKEGEYGPEDDLLAEVMRSYWTNFAKTGNPEGKGLPAWPKYEAGSEYTMHFGNDGAQAEKMISTKAEERVIDFCVRTPGMLCSLEGF